MVDVNGLLGAPGALVPVRESAQQERQSPRPKSVVHAVREHVSEPVPTPAAGVLGKRGELAEAKGYVPRAPWTTKPAVTAVHALEPAQMLVSGAPGVPAEAKASALRARSPLRPVVTAEHKTRPVRTAANGAFGAPVAERVYVLLPGQRPRARPAATVEVRLVSGPAVILADGEIGPHGVSVSVNPSVAPDSSTPKHVATVATGTAPARTPVNGESGGPVVPKGHVLPPPTAAKPAGTVGIRAVRVSTPVSGAVGTFVPVKAHVRAARLKARSAETVERKAGHVAVSVTGDPGGPVWAKGSAETA